MDQWFYEATDSRQFEPLQLSEAGSELLAVVRSTVIERSLAVVLLPLHPARDLVTLHPLLVISGYLDPEPLVPIHLRTAVFPACAPARAAYLRLMVTVGQLRDAEREARRRDYQKWPRLQDRPYSSLLEEPDWYGRLRRRGYGENDLVRIHDCFPAFSPRDSDDWRLIASREYLGRARLNQESILLLPASFEPEGFQASVEQTGLLLVDLQGDPTAAVRQKAKRLLEVASILPRLVVVSDPTLIRTIVQPLADVSIHEVDLGAPARPLTQGNEPVPASPQVPEFHATIDRADGSSSQRLPCEELGILARREDAAGQVARGIQKLYWDVATCPAPVAAFVEQRLRLQGVLAPADALLMLKSEARTVSHEQAEILLEMVDAIRGMLESPAESFRWTIAREAAEEVLFNTTDGAGSVILCRNGIHACALRDALARSIGCQEAELEENGLYVRGCRQFARGSVEAVRVLLTCWMGWPGVRAGLLSRPHRMDLILNRPEAAWALHEVSMLSAGLPGTGLLAESAARITQAIGQRAPDYQPIDLHGFTQLPSIEGHPAAYSTYDTPDDGEPVLCKRVDLDGDASLFVPVDDEIDILDEDGSHIRTVAVEGLTPGARIVLIDSEDQHTLSAFLRHELAQNPLEEFWRTTVEEFHADISSAIATKGLGVPEIMTMLTAHGIRRHPGTIRNWLSGFRFDPLGGDVHYAPGTREDFDALCGVLGILLDRQRRDLAYQCAVMLRRVNRRRGRKLGQLLRAVVQDEVDPVDLAEFADEYGIDVEDLRSTARVYRVRSVSSTTERIPRSRVLVPLEAYLCP